MREKKRTQTTEKNSLFHSELDYCWFSHDVIKIHTGEFSMLLTFSFMKYIGAAENEYFNKLSLREGFPFCDRSELEFLSFCVTRHLGGQESYLVD